MKGLKTSNIKSNASSDEQKKSTESNNNLKMNSFFAGIGGFDLGFEQAGIRSIFQCEINSFCQSVLSRHWNNVTLTGDINEIKPENIPDAEIWCGGFPCQDISVARGTTRPGLNGTRSGLFFKFAELVSINKPKIVILENVTGLLNSNSGRDFGLILNVFLKMGYAVSWRILNSRYFGVPQSRPRVFICAWLGEPSKALYTLFEKEKAPNLPLERKEFLEVTGDLKKGPIVPKIAYCLAATSGRHTGTDWSRTYVTYPTRVRRLTPEEYELLQGFPMGWTLPNSDQHGDTDEIDTLRYSAIGNAVAVPVIKWIAKRIIEANSHQKTFEIPENNKLDNEYFRNIAKTNQVSPEDLDNFLESIFSISEVAPEYLKNYLKNIVYLPNTEEIDQEQKYSWPNSGIAWGKACISKQTPPAPTHLTKSKLIDILMNEPIDERFFLSNNAARGILRRVSSQNRKLFEPLFQALLLLSTQSTEIKNYNEEFELELIADA